MLYYNSNNITHKAAPSRAGEPHLQAMRARGRSARTPAAKAPRLSTLRPDSENLRAMSQTATLLCAQCRVPAYQGTANGAAVATCPSCGRTDPLDSAQHDAACSLEQACAEDAAPDLDAAPLQFRFGPRERAMHRFIFATR